MSGTASAPGVDVEVREHVCASGARGRVYELTVRNPTRLNAVGTSVCEQLLGALERVAADPEARAAVLRGSGERAFIGGADLNELAELDAQSATEFITLLHRACDALRRLPVPVIARLRGHCLGAGLELASSCDLRLAASDARFGMPEVHMGIPSVIEAALLPRLLGAGRARDLVLTGRVLDARTAERWGLVEAVVPPAHLDRLVLERLDALLQADARALRLQKELCLLWESLPLDAAISAGIDALAEAYRGDAPGQRIRRFLERKRRGR